VRVLVDEVGQVSIRVFRCCLLISINLIGKACGRRNRGPLGCFMLSVAIFVNHIRITIITRFSPLGIPLMTIFKRAVRETAHEKGYGPFP